MNFHLNLYAYGQILACTTEVLLNVSMRVLRLFTCQYSIGIDYFFCFAFQMHEFRSLALVGLCLPKLCFPSFLKFQLANEQMLDMHATSTMQMEMLCGKVVKRI